MDMKCYLVMILIFISIVTNELKILKNTFIDHSVFIFYGGSVYIFHSFFCQFVSSFLIIDCKKWFFLLIYKTFKNMIRILIIWHMCCENIFPQLTYLFIFYMVPFDN